MSQKKIKEDRRRFIKEATALGVGSLVAGCTTNHKTPERKLAGRPVPATKDQDPDFVIVGSGAGGGPLAARLATAGYKVTVLEAGGDYKGEDYSGKTKADLPALHTKTSEEPELSWEFFVKHYSDPKKLERDSKFDNAKSRAKKGILYPRAASLGGCTSHNAMITMYPDNSDWLNIANIAEKNGEDAASWSPERMRGLYEKLEYKNTTSLKDFVRTLLQEDGSWLSTEQAATKTLLRNPRFKQALTELAMYDEAIAKGAGSAEGVERFEKTYTQLEKLASQQKLDVNEWSWIKNKIDKVAAVTQATKNGVRSGPRDFLIATKERLEKEGKGHLLTIISKALVTKVNVEEQGGRKVATGVEYIDGAERLYEADPRTKSKTDRQFNNAWSSIKGDDRRMKKLKAGKEVILAGGAFNTPQLLMLSGIGDPEVLKGKVELVHELPGVGKNLQDRYEVGVITEMDFQEPHESLKKCFYGYGPGGFEKDPCRKAYEANWGNADPTDNIHPYGFNGVIGGLVKKSEMAKKTHGNPDLFIFAIPASFKGYYPGYSAETRGKTDKERATMNFFTWAILKGHTQNRAGVVGLRSSNPLRTPHIDFKYFEEGAEHDLNAMVEAIKLVRDVNSKMDGVIKETVPGKEAESDEDLKTFIRDEAWGHHASCSCKMGTQDDKMAVVNTKFQVYGVEGLRIVDASVFPKIPGLFVVVPVYMIAEKAAEEIDQQYS